MNPKAEEYKSYLLEQFNKRQGKTQGVTSPIPEMKNPLPGETQPDSFQQSWMDTSNKIEGAKTNVKNTVRNIPSMVKESLPKIATPSFSLPKVSLPKVSLPKIQIGTTLKSKPKATPTPKNVPVQKSTPIPTPTLNPKASWNNFVDFVMREGGKRGYSGVALAKQKALESGFGESPFAKERNNYGGIGAYDSNPDNAFSFKSPEEYMNYYFDMIKKRFPKAYANRKDPEKFVQSLKDEGYASDPEYVWKVLNTSPWR